MPFIDEKVFDDNMRALFAARGSYTSKPKQEELKRYWYLEFRSCDERAFIRTMQELKFDGEGGFPSFRDFKDRYNIIMPTAAIAKSREYCGLCANGTVIYRGIVQETQQVNDMAAGCSRCSPNRDTQINPHDLHKDRLGYLRTFEALAKDRESGALYPQNDPEAKVVIQEIPQPVNGKEMARAMFGTENPKDEKIRAKSIKEASELPDVPY